MALSLLQNAVEFVYRSRSMEASQPSGFQELLQEKTGENRPIPEENRQKPAKTEENLWKCAVFR
ncbi:MAG: hypothetical protein ACYCPD_00725 [Acidobacteriaceae bacterium]